MDTNLSLTPGSDYALRFEVTTPGSDPRDLTNLLVSFRVLRSTQDLDEAAVFLGTEAGGNVVISFTREDGIVDILVPAATTAKFAIGRTYYWSLILTGSGVNEIYSRGQLFAFLPATT